MNLQPLALAMLVALPATLTAQEEPAAAEQPQAPAARHEAHAALQTLVGDWRSITRTEAMPGVPGMEEPTESTGTEHAELICDGLWLKSDYRGTFAGEPFAGIFLAGYDPTAKQYVGLWIGSGEADCEVARFEGTYDADSDTWTWSGDTPDGRMTSTCRFDTPNRSVETCYMETPDGEKVKCMEIVRERSSKPVAADASARIPDDLPEQRTRLLTDVGHWNATVETSAAGSEPTRDRATERVVPVLDGRWLWTNFSGRIHGAPFEGHALYRWDSAENHYVSYWIDSMSPTFTKTTGTFDESAGSLTLSGTSRDPSGKKLKIRQVISHADDGTRTCQMQFGTGENASQMQITYERAGSRK